MQNKTATRAFSVLALALLVGVATAEETGTVGDLGRIQTDTLLLKAKVNRATARLELDSKSKTGVVSEVDAPVVKNVFGIGGKMVATFIYSNGLTVDGKQGDTIIGGFKVISITVDKVELSKDKKVFAVGFSATPPTQTHTAGAPGLPGSAGYPPIVR